MNKPNDEQLKLCKITLDRYQLLEKNVLDELFKCFTIKTFKKKQIILRDGTLCKNMGFIYSGILRLFEMVDGEDHTIYFNFQPKNPFVSDFESFISQKPAKFSIEAVTDSTVIFIERNDIYRLFDKYHSMEKLGRILAEVHYIAAMDRIKSFQSKNTKEMYLELIKMYPDLNKDVPDRMVASYLGVRKETFSRIKKEILFDKC